MKKNLKHTGLLLLIAFTAYHSVYFKSLKDVKVNADGFNAAAFAQEFYQQQLLPLADSTLSLSNLLAQLKSNKEATFNRYGHSLSIGSLRYFLVKGEGLAAAVDSNYVTLQLVDSGRKQISLTTELVFGNAIRDASGKISLSAFSNLSDVNNISLELNKIVREKVLPPFRQKVAVGDTIRFYGAVELNQERLNLESLEVIPIELQNLNK